MNGGDLTKEEVNQHLLELGGLVKPGHTGRVLSFSSPIQVEGGSFAHCVNILWLHYLCEVSLNGGGVAAQKLADLALERIEEILEEDK